MLLQRLICRKGDLFANLISTDSAKKCIRSVIGSVQTHQKNILERLLKLLKGDDLYKIEAKILTDNFWTDNSLLLEFKTLISEWNVLLTVSNKLLNPDWSVEYREAFMLLKQLEAHFKQKIAEYFSTLDKTTLAKMHFMFDHIQDCIYMVAIASNVQKWTQ